VDSLSRPGPHGNRLHLAANFLRPFLHRERQLVPAESYVHAEWKQWRVGVDYHVEVDKDFYSVPHTLLRETMWARITARTVEVFHHGQRVAAHVRSSSDRKHTTVRDHMPSSHQRYADWTLERITRQADDALQKRSQEVGPRRGATLPMRP
jgi:transposase